MATLNTVDDGVRKVIDPPYPVLADPNHEVAESFNVYDLFDNGIAAPSVFIIDRDGRVVWSYVGRSSRDRPAVSTILDHMS